MSGYIDARAQAAAILITEAQRLAAFVPPPCAPDDSMRYPRVILAQVDG